MKKYLNKKTILILAAIPVLVLLFFVLRHFLPANNGSFTFDYIPVQFKEDGKISLMDMEGKIVLADEFAPKSEILCTNGIITEYVESDPDFVRYFKMNGNKLEEVSKRKYKIGTPFHEGYALVRDEEGILNLIDKKGNETSLQTVEGMEVVRVSMISDGLLRAKINTGEWGYLNPSGTWKIKPAYKMAESFVDGYARVLDANGNMLVIGKNGKEIMKGKESFSYQPVSEGLIGYSEEAETKVRYYGFLNTSHEKVIKDNKYTSVVPFFAGYSVVESEDGMYGVIDKKGEIYGELRTKFKDNPVILKSGFAVVDNEKLKLFDNKGVLAKTLEDYDKIIPVNNELLIAKLTGKDKYDMITAKGKVLSKESFLLTSDLGKFSNRNELLESLKNFSIESAWLNFSAIYNSAFRDLGVEGVYGLKANSNVKQVMQVFEKLQSTDTKGGGNKTVDTEDNYRYYFKMEKKEAKEEAAKAGTIVPSDSTAFDAPQGQPAVKDPYPGIESYVDYIESKEFYSSPMRFSAKAVFTDILKTSKFEFVEDPFDRTMNYQLTGYELNTTARLTTLRIDYSYGSASASVFDKKMEEKLLAAGWKKAGEGEFTNQRNAYKLRLGYGHLEIIYAEGLANNEYNELPVTGYEAAAADTMK